MTRPDDAERLAELRAQLSADPSLDAGNVTVAFRDGALHLSGRITDDRAWFAIVKLASGFASRVVDEIEMRREARWHARVPRPTQRGSDNADDAPAGQAERTCLTGASAGRL